MTAAGGTTDRRKNELFSAVNGLPAHLEPKQELDQQLADLSVAVKAKQVN